MMSENPKDLLARDNLEGNLVARVEQLEWLVMALANRETRADFIDEIAVDLGSFLSGEPVALRPADAGDIEGDGARPFVSSDGVLMSDGKLYYIGTVDAEDDLTFGVRAEDGGGIYGGGAGVFDKYGHHIVGLRAAQDHIAASPDGSVVRRAMLEMFLPEGATTPAYRIWFGENAAGTELVVNGNFATGDATGWTATLSGASSFTVSQLAGVGYRSTLARAAGQSGSVQSATAFAVTAYKNYRVRLKATGSGADSVTLTARVDWYNAGASLISSSIVLSKTAVMTGGEAYIPPMQVDTSVHAPAGAVTARVYWTVSAGGQITVWEISMQEMTNSSQIVFDDLGLSVLKWVSSNVPDDGVDQNNSVATSTGTQTMVLKVFRPTKLTGLLYDVRNSGDYTLRQLAEPGLTASAFRTLWSGNVAAGGEINMAFADPVVLLPGTHYLGLTRTTGATTWWSNSGDSYTQGGGAAERPAWRMEGLYHGTTLNAQIPGVKVQCLIGDWS